MNDDLKKELDKLAQELTPYASGTDCILQAINDLSAKMDHAEAESKRKEKSDFRRFVFSSVICLLTLITGIVAAVAAVLAVIPH